MPYLLPPPLPPLMLPPCLLLSLSTFLLHCVPLTMLPISPCHYCLTLEDWNTPIPKAPPIFSHVAFSNIIGLSILSFTFSFFLSMTHLYYGTLALEKLICFYPWKSLPLYLRRHSNIRQQDTIKRKNAIKC